MTALDTKAKLIAAAEHHVRTTGVDGFSYADLAQQIGIRKASIHYHFPTKGDLLTATMAQYAAQVMSALHDIETNAPTAPEQLNAFIDLYRDALQGGETLCLCVAFTVSQNGLSDATRAEIQSFRAQVLEWLERVLSHATRDTNAAELLALVEGAQIAARVARNASAFDRATDRFRKSLAVSGTT